jgi:hypothetical protein
MQKWEYKMLYRTRGINRAGRDGFRPVENWNVLDMMPKLQSLGLEGWELVSVTPSSDFGGDLSQGVGHVVAGLTTTESWVFKRPIEE